MEENQNLKILVCAHKQDFVMNNDMFMPIQVGKNLSNVDLGFQGDNTGDNISDKNRSFCELTAMYWAWKNLKNVDYIGLAHYRRYFDLNCKGNQPIYKISMADFLKKSEGEGFAKSRYLDILKTHDLIAQKPMVSPNSLALDYCFYHISEDLRTLEHVVHDLYPEYDNAFRRVVFRGNKQRGFNMMVTSWRLFDNYAKWLFDILFEVERRVDISFYSPSQKRIFGYMSERLLSVYIEKNCLKVYNAPVRLINDRKDDEVSDFYYLIRRAKANLSFKLSLGR